MSAGRILLVDDQSLVLDGLEALIGTQRDLVVVGRALDGREALTRAAELQPDVVLMDISMPQMDGIESTRAMRKVSPGSRVLVLSMYNNREFVHELLDAGAAGYLLKNTGKEELLHALRVVASGGEYLGEAVRAVMRQPDRFRQRIGDKGYIPLTKREKEIVQLICAELSTTDIAGRLFISPQTVETHRKNILQKLDLHNTAGLVKYAMERGWVPGIA